MAYAANSGGATAAAAAAIAQAIKASGAIVRLEPDDFNKILSRTSKPLVVIAKGGFFKPHYQYLTAYKGLMFFTKSPTELMLPGDTEIIAAREIWIP
ncbi:MAG: hypothetical protein Q7T57_03650 [Dehalococcoidales bacterium]|nr:hypothetical protein [Dehalococcoidales bacterium]